MATNSPKFLKPGFVYHIRRSPDALPMAVDALPDLDDYLWEENFPEVPVSEFSNSDKLIDIQKNPNILGSLILEVFHHFMACGHKGSESYQVFETLKQEFPDLFRGHTSVNPDYIHGDIIVVVVALPDGRQACTIGVLQNPDRTPPRPVTANTALTWDGMYNLRILPGHEVSNTNIHDRIMRK